MITGPGSGPGALFFDRDPPVGAGHPRPVAASILVGTQHFAHGAGCEAAVSADIDRVLDELDGPIGHGEIRAAGVEASKPILAEAKACRVRNPIWREEYGGETRGPHRTGFVGGGIQPRNDECPGGRVTTLGGVVILELDRNVTNRERRRRFVDEP